MQPDELFHGIPVVDERTGCHGQPVKVLCRGNLRSVSNEGYRARGILVPLADLGKVAKQAITLQKGRHA